MADRIRKRRRINGLMEIRKIGYQDIGLGD